MDISAADSARLALLVLYAADSCNGAEAASTAVTPDPRIGQAGWTVLGWLTGSDRVEGLGRIVRYGYLAVRQDQYVIAIRGTSGVAEWIKDAEFRMVPHPTLPDAMVEDGFWSIRQSMQLVPVGPSALPAGTPLVQALHQIIGQHPVTVLGHSLGGAIATYLAHDLALLAMQVNLRVYASPRPGNAAYVGFAARALAGHHAGFHLEDDIVPDTPLFDPLQLQAYHALPDITPLDADLIESGVTCRHHLLSYIAALDRTTWEQARRDPHFTPDADCAGCIRA